MNGRSAADAGIIAGNECRQVGLRVLELQLAAARIVAEILVKLAIGKPVGASRLRLRTAMHVMVTVSLGGRAMRTTVITRVIAPGFHRHGARRQREIEPDSNEQPEGFATPGLPFRAVSRMTQLLVSNRFSVKRLVLLRAQVKDVGHAPQNMNWTESWLAPTDDSQSLLSSQT